MKRSYLLLLLSLSVLLLGIIGYVYYDYNTGKKKREQSKTRVDVISDLQQSVITTSAQVYSSGAESGIDPEDLKDALLDNDCALSPIDGKCTTGFELKDGCCVIPDDLSEMQRNEYKARVSKLLKQIGINIMADHLITNIIPRMIKRGRYISKLSKLLPRGGQMTSKLTARVIGRIAARISQKLAIRSAMLTLKLLTKLGAGPVGWALLVFDILSAVADIGDGGNYDSFTSNENLLKMRNQAIYKLWEARKKAGLDLPALFPFTELFPLESEEAERVTAELFQTMTIEVLASKEEYSDLLVDLLIASLEDELNETSDTAPPTNEEIDKMLGDVWEITRREKGKKIDEKLYTELVRIIKLRTPEEKALSIYDENDIMLLQEFSSDKEMGISVSKKGADKWNKQQETSWFEYNDPYSPKPLPEDYAPPLYASYSDKYYTLDINNPGTLSNPNIVIKSAVKEATFVYPFGSLFTSCEKTRTSAKYKKPINPRDYGVSLDTKTGICNYTEDYCRRYGLDHKSRTSGSGETYYNCELSKDQEALEFIFGTAFTRGSKRVWQDRIDDFNSGDPGKIALATAMTIVDPTGASEVMQQQKLENYAKNKEKHGDIKAALIMGADFTGMVQPFVENMDEKLDGRDKFCETGDECLRFHAKHRGGNTMGWSVRNKDGEIYSMGQAFQNEVKHNEDHVFYIPKDGYFKVSCFGIGGEKRNYSYDEVVAHNPFRVSCFLGKIDTSDRSSEAVFFAKAGEGLKDTGNAIARDAEAAANSPAGQAIAGAANTAGQAIEGAANTAGDAIVTGVNNFANNAEDNLNAIGSGLKSVGSFLGR